MHRGMKNSLWWTSLLQQVTRFRSSYNFGQLLRILLCAVNLFSFSHIVSSDSSFSIHNALYFVKYPSRATQNSPEVRRWPLGRGLKTPDLGGTMPHRKRTEAVDQLNRRSPMNETIYNNAFVILGHLVLKNEHLYTYKGLFLIIQLLYVQKTLKFPLCCANFWMYFVGVRSRLASISSNFSSVKTVRLRFRFLFTTEPVVRIPSQYREL